MHIDNEFLNMEQSQYLNMHYKYIDRIICCSSFMKSKLYERITLDDICRQTFYSKTFLNEIFKKNTGASIMKYYNRLKMNEAKRLLRAGNTPAEVASKLRFESASYFTKVFKKHTGATPMEYKKKLL